MAERYRNIIEVPERGYHYFRHYFIPHEGNDHRPLALRPNALKLYSVLLIVVKLTVTGFLYGLYPSEGSFAELTASKIFELTNQSRRASGFTPLKISTQLNKAAQAKGQDMLRAGYFDHTAPDGKKFWQWIQEAGYTYTTAGENLAMDFTTAESAHNALMASPSHRSNILRTSYVEVGLAVVQGKINGHDTTLLVEIFGAPLRAKQKAAPVKSVATAQPPAAQQPSQPTVASAQITTTTYQAKYVGRSDEQFVLLTNSTITVWVDFQNVGTAVWTNNGPNFLALNVTDPAGRTSPFADPSWPEPYRPAILQQPTVQPGGVGRFTMTLRVPDTAGDYHERFALVAENLTWVEDGTVGLPIRVVAPEPTAATESSPSSEGYTPQETVQQAFQTTVVEVTPHNETTGRVQPAANEPAPLVVAAPAFASADWRSALTDWSLRFFWALLLFLTVGLLFNIMVNIRLQRHRVIVQTLLVIALTTFMLLVRFHFAERITRVLVT